MEKKKKVLKRPSFIVIKGLETFLGLHSYKNQNRYKSVKKINVSKKRGKNIKSPLPEINRSEMGVTLIKREVY